MTPALLREAGEALYGARWQSDLARDLGVADRTMRRWVAGEFSIPQAVSADLMAILNDRDAAIYIIRRKIGSVLI